MWIRERCTRAVREIGGAGQPVQIERHCKRCRQRRTVYKGCKRERGRRAARRERKGLQDTQRNTENKGSKRERRAGQPVKKKRKCKTCSGHGVNGHEDG